MTSQTVFITNGSTDVTIDVDLLQDAGATSPGDPLTGLVYNSAGLTCYYREGGIGAVTQLTLATLALVTTAHSDGGFIELDSTNMPGRYRLDLSDIMCSSSSGQTTIVLNGAADLATHTIHMVKYVPTNVVEWNSAAVATPTTAGVPEVDVTFVSGTAQTANDNGADINAILVDTNSLNDTKIPQTLNLTASGNIGIDWANVENPTTALDLSGTDIQLVDTTTTNTDMLTAAAVTGAVNDHQISDSIPADGTLPTIEQALYMIAQQLQESVLSGTTISVKKVDGSTELFTLTVNNATNPTTITRAT